ncbi:hypothetical protein B0H14DRAFT_2632101 [Mycena olivaceomarginata]|nr:hypothetical protein B0H14DRAFT_2632101 [Mycena olivaceomarginata]
MHTRRTCLIQQFRFVRKRPDERDGTRSGLVAPPRGPARCKNASSLLGGLAEWAREGKEQHKDSSARFPSHPSRQFFSMFPRYTNAAGQAAHRKFQADTARQDEWLRNANNDGPLPIHEPYQQQPIFDIRNTDPSAADLRVAQEQLAVANWSRSLLTFERNTTQSSPNDFPLLGITNPSLPSPSNMLAGHEVYRQPSGFNRLRFAELPLCPHFANPSCTEFECRMIYHTAKDKDNGGTIHYLQVPPRCSLFPATRKDEAKDKFPEPSALLPSRLAPKREPGVKRQSSVKAESSILATAKEQTLGQRTRHSSSRPQLPPRPLKRENTLICIGAPSREIIDLDADDDVLIPGSSSPPTSSHVSTASPSPSSSSSRLTRPQPQARPIGPASLRLDPVYRYTEEEARRNLQRDPLLAALTAADAKRFADTKHYGSSFWLQDGPRGVGYMDARFPTRLRPYSSGGHLANRIQMAGPVGPAPVTNFLFALATTHGVLGSSYTNFLTCCVFVSAAAATSRRLPISATSGSTGTTTSASTTPRSPSPLPSHASHTCPSAPYREFGSLTALGIALYALNTVLGLPDDIFEAVRIGLVACGSCGMIRTVHAHIAHRPGGLCNDPGAGDSYYVALNADAVAVIGPEGEHHVISTEERGLATNTSRGVALITWDCIVAAAAGEHCHQTQTLLEPLPPRRHDQNLWTTREPPTNLTAEPRTGSSLTSADASTPNAPSTRPNSFFEFPPQPPVRTPPPNLSVAAGFFSPFPDHRPRCQTKRWGTSPSAPSDTYPKALAAPLSSLPTTTTTPPARLAAAAAATRDLEAKAALWGEYQQRPADVISRFDRVAEISAPRGRASDDNLPKHETSCRQLRARWAHCDCSCKQHRVARRQARQEQRLSRWFSAMREEEGGTMTRVTP